MLLSGERQVAPTPDGIRRDHVARYEFARSLIGGGKTVIDLACGVGYGAAILADAGNRVLAVDREPEAIDYGRKHYRRHGIAWLCEDVTALRFGEPRDIAVCFETIEHLADPLPMLKSLRAAAPLLIASVPNETVFPFKNYTFHHRHYTRAQFEALLTEAGYRVTGWFGQQGPHSEVEPDIEGRTLIVTAERIDIEETAAPVAPKRVAICGLGPSINVFFELTRRLGGSSAYVDEVWGVNALGDVLRCDRVFHMDDMLVQEARAAANPDSNIAAMVKWLKTHPGPVYTSVPRPGYPGMVAFPLRDVLNGKYDSNGGAPYFNSTVAYAIAFAIHLGVKEIALYGIDFTYANSHRAEQGRACVEFWLGIAAARGIGIEIPEQSSLLDACAPERERLYGYDCVDVVLTDRTDGSLDVAFKPREDIPTAAEIEARYDHSKHPNRLVQAQDS